MQGNSGSSSNLQEVTLHSVVKVEQVGVLLDRLRAISAESSRPLKVYEAYFNYAIPGQQQAEVRVHYDLRRADQQWVASYLGDESFQNRRTASVLIRPLYSVNVSEHILSFLPLSGYRFNFEFLREGYLFRHQPSNISISVCSINKLQERFHPESGQLLFPLSSQSIAAELPKVGNVEVPSAVWLVEMRKVAGDEKLQRVQEEMIAFSELLLPIVNMSKVSLHTLQRPGA